MSRGRPAGRRVARPEPVQTPTRPDRALLVALVLVLATAAVLVAAGTTHRLAGRHAAATRTATVSRDFSCTGGVPGAMMRVGHVGAAVPGALQLDGKPATERAMSLTGRTGHVFASSRQATSAYAVRWATGRGWLAAGSCPSPRAEWWFLGPSGGTAHDSVVELDNPRDGDALVDVDVLGPQGAVDAPALHGLRIPSHQGMRLDLHKVAASFGDLAVHVTAMRGLVSASVAETWSGDLVSRRAHDWVTDQPAADRHSTLVGLAPGSGPANVLLANPAATEAVVRLQFVGPQGTFAPTTDATVRVPPDTVLPVGMNHLSEAKPLAIQVRSQVPVAATIRTTRGLDETYAGAVEPIGTAAVVGLPPSVTAGVVLVAGSGGGHVTVIGYDESGHQVGSRSVTVRPRAATRVALWPRARAVRVVGTTDENVRGAVLLGGRGASTVATIPLSPTDNDTHVPEVRPRW